jgi:hypothetical protein
LAHPKSFNNLQNGETETFQLPNASATAESVSGDANEFDDEADVPTSSDDQLKFNNFQIPWHKLNDDLSFER